MVQWSFLVNLMKTLGTFHFPDHGHLFRRKAHDQCNPIKTDLRTLAYSVGMDIVMCRYKVQNSYSHLDNSLTIETTHGDSISIVEGSTKCRPRTLFGPHLMADLPTSSFR